MRSVRPVVSVAVHLLLVIAALGVVLVTTSDPAYPPLRVALVASVAVLAAVSLFGRFSLGLGPVGGSVAPRVVRMAGTGLAGAGAAGVVLGLAQGDSLSERAHSGVPVYTVVLALYLGAFLAVTRRDSGLPPRALVTGVGLGLLAAALFTAAVPVLPPGLIRLAFLLIAAAAAGAGFLTRPAAAWLRARSETAAAATPAVG
jgi:hypothetical protein